MSTKRKVASVAFTGVATMAATAIGMPAAFAAGSTYHIRGTSAAGPLYNGAIGAVNKAGTSTVLKDSNTGAILKCPHAKVTGTIPLGDSTGTTPHLAATTKVVFGTTASPCVLSGTTIKFTASASATLNINTLTGTGATGTITSVHNTHLAGGLFGNSCTATFNSQVKNLSGTYTNPTSTTNGILAVTGPSKAIKVTAATGCLGKINKSDLTKFTGTFSLSTPASQLWIN
jgi:hypothetical protein